jgi:hypothetical protein
VHRAIKPLEELLVSFLAAFNRKALWVDALNTNFFRRLIFDFITAWPPNSTRFSCFPAFLIRHLSSDSAPGMLTKLICLIRTASR